MYVYKNNCIYTRGNCVEFISLNVKESERALVEKVISICRSLLARALLKDKMFIDSRLVLVSKMKKVKLLRLIKNTKNLDFASELVYMVQLV